MKKQLGRSTVAVMLCTLAVTAAAHADTYGRQERIRLMSTPPIEVVATLDAGAAQSSLKTADLKYFVRDGDTWARFVVDNGSVLAGSRVTIERPVLKDVKVRLRNGGIEHHPVVQLDLCIGDRLLKPRLSLSDRHSYTPPLVIGQDELARLGSVDSSREFTHDALCKPEPASDTKVLGELDASPSSAK